MMMTVSFIMTSAALFMTRATGPPASPAINVATPTMIAKKMMASTSPLAMASTGLVGMIDNSVRMICSATPPGAGLAASRSRAWSMSAVETAERSKPAPGWMIVPIARPKQTAMTVVTMYIARARPPRLPSRLGSPIARTPDTRVVKISGTTSIWIRLMKASPTGLNQVVTIADACSGPAP